MNGWVNNPEAGDLRRHRAHYDVTVMLHKIVSMITLLIMETTVNVSSVEEDDELIIVTCSLALVNYDSNLSSYLMTAIHSSWSFSGPFYWHGLTLIPAWITNCIHDKVWDEITHPFLKFNGATVEV